MKWIVRITGLTLGLSLLLIIGLQTTAAQIDTFYVDAGTGSDTTGDGSDGKPWQSIQHAANQVGPGDTVLINPGSYDGGITVDTPGVEMAPITFKGNGAGVIIEGSGGERDAFFITEADYIIVDGLTIQHADRAGLRISLSNHVTIRNCTFIDNFRWGIFTDFSDYTLIENNESAGAEDEHGIYISNSSDFPTIRNNRLHHNHANGLHMNGDISQGGDGIISGAVVEGNIIYENGTGGGSGINMDGVTNSIIRNNLLYNNHASGISLYQIDGGSGSQNNRILNNTIIMASDARWAINIPDTVDTGNQIFNNILLNQHSWKGSILIAEPDQASFQSDYNIVVNGFNTNGYNADNTNGLDLASWQALGYDTHSIIATADEIFIDVATNDYRLKEGGPAVDTGLTLPEVLTDLDGHGRPAGLGYDIGAYEYGSTVTTPLDHAVYLPIILVGS